MRKGLVSVVALVASFGLLMSCSDTTGGSTSSTSSTSSSSSQISSSSASISTSVDANHKINPYTRDTTSGTRDGFSTKIGIEKAKSNDSLLTSSVTQVTSNGDMMAKVAADEWGIGYASFSDLSANTGVKGIEIEGVAASEATVQDGSYKLQRNFNYVIPAAGENDRSGVKMALIYSYVAFMHSVEGLAVIKNKGGILDSSVINSAQSWDDIIADTTDNPWATTLGLTSSGATNTSITSETVYFVGSTSVQDMSTDLSTAWSALFGSNEPQINHNHTGSGDAVKKVADGSGDIGFASREFTDAEKSAHTTWTFGKICMDAISVIINADNDLISNITLQQLRDIYVNPTAIADSATSETNFGVDYSDETPITTWSQLVD